MARTWLSVTVELLGGRGDEFWPWPGRILAVGPGHTFAQLAEAINEAFARWDRSHLCEFTLSDGADRWLPVDRHGSHSGWRDMAAFARRHRDVELRERLERAIEGRGGFRRFRDLVHEEGLGRSWGVFSADRQAGRARQGLADEGIRVG